MHHVPTVYPACCQVTQSGKRTAVSLNCSPEQRESSRLFLMTKNDLLWFFSEETLKNTKPSFIYIASVSPAVVSHSDISTGCSSTLVTLFVRKPSKTGFIMIKKSNSKVLLIRLVSHHNHYPDVFFESNKHT